MSWWVLKRRVHVSWLISFASLAFSAGVFFAQYRQLAVFAVIISGILMVLAGLVWNRLYMVPLLITGAFILGLSRGSISQIDLAKYHEYYGKTVSVAGRVSDDSDSASSGQISLRLDNIKIENKSFSGKIWVATASADIKRGDNLVISGKLLAGFGTYAGVIYRAEIIKLTQPNPGDLAREIRDWFSGAIKRSLPEPQASLGIGYLVGQKKALPADMVVALQTVGLTHVVVASGYNLTILVRLARRLFEKVSKYLSAVSALAMIFGFLAITGNSPSMSRAAIISVLSLGAWYYGRKFHPIILLSFAMMLTLLFNPSYIWGDLGWQLSFAAFGGVIILAPLLQRYFFGDKKPGFVGQILVETVSAQIATAPIIVYAFGLFSNVAIVSNLMVLPLVPLAMLLTFISGLGALVWPALATIIGAPASWLLTYMVKVIEFFAELPWAASQVKISALVVWLCYLIIIGLGVYLWRVTKYNLRESNIVE